MGAPYTPVASAARTTSGNSGSLDADEKVLNLLVNVSAVSGTSPSMALSILWSNNGTDFHDADGTADTFAAITAASKKVKQFTVKGAYYRIDWAITGTTPSFTFSVSALTGP